MTWMTWRSEATLIAREASTTRCTSSSPISWSGRATATTPGEFWEVRWPPARETTTDSMRWPAMRSAATAAAWMEAMVFSRLITTPLRRPSEGASPTPMMLMGFPGSSDSAMTTATRLVPRSRPTVRLRRDKTGCGASWLERGLDVGAGCRGLYRLLGGVRTRFCGSGAGKGHALWSGGGSWGSPGVVGVGFRVGMAVLVGLPAAAGRGVADGQAWRLRY